MHHHRRLCLKIKVKQLNTNLKIKKTCKILTWWHYVDQRLFLNIYDVRDDREPNA